MVGEDGYVHYDIADPHAPVVGAEHRTSKKPRHGIALCLSGGGYRAMLFHLGALWRLAELDYLRELTHVCSVSGGSITAGRLGLVWSRLFDANGAVDLGAFRSELVEPLCRLASVTIDRSAALTGILLPTVSAATVLEHALRDHVFDDATLLHLPAPRVRHAPRFVIAATNVQDGALWKFSRESMGDWRVGYITDPHDVPLARAVAASAAYPPVLSPLVMDVSPARFSPSKKASLQTEAYRSRIVLMDGGVYDNLGLECAYKRCETLLVSDAGMALALQPTPSTNLLCHARRAATTLMSQVTALRKRQLIAAFKGRERMGTYWGIGSDVSAYVGLRDPIRDITPRCVECLATTPTRMKKLSEAKQQALISWGYAICDTAMRRWVIPNRPRPARLPYDVECPDDCCGRPR